MNDPFSYSGRWGSLGLDCSNCAHFLGPDSWPDEQAVSSCKRHNKSLKLQLTDSGYKEGEWFCSSFSNDGTANAVAANEFEAVRPLLASGVLYRALGPSTDFFEIQLGAVGNDT